MVSYLWKSLNFLTRFEHRRTARANKYEQKHCYENADMGTESHYESHASNAKVYSPSEPTLLERVKSIFGKPKPWPELELITPREAVHGMAPALITETTCNKRSDAKALKSPNRLPPLA